MNPACTARGIRRWCARWASWIVFARLSSWSSLRRSRGRFLRKSRAIAASPERASSISAEHTAAASAALRSVKTPRKTPSATSSSLSCLRPAMSRPRGSSRRSRTAPNCSSTSTTLRNSCQYALLNCSSARRRTPRRSVSVSSSRHSRSHLGWAPQGHRWHSIDESAASGPCARSRSRSSGTDSRASSAARWRSPRPSRPRSRGTEKGGVAQKIRLTTPLFARTTAPWGRSASMSTRWPRIEWTPRISAAGLALILGVHSIRGHRVLIDALLPHGAVVRAKSGVVKRIFWATPPFSVPRDRGRDGRGLRHLAAELARLSVPELLERERAQGPEAVLSSIECHRCPWGAQPRCDREWRELETLTERLGVRRRALEQFRSAYWQEFLNVVEVLEQFGAVRDRRLEPRGRLIAGLRHDNELLVAESVFRGVVTDLNAAEAAAVCSALIEEARSGEAAIARDFLKKRPRLRRKLDQLESLANTIHEAQRAHHLRIPLAVHAGFMPAVYRWASGEDDWGAIVEESFGGHEGDLIRAMRRLIDLLRQLAESPEVPPETARLLAQVARIIDRSIVLESALI